MKAVIIGASGLIGTSLVRQLADDDGFSNIVTLGRRPAFEGIDKVANHLVDFDHLDDAAALISGDVMFSALGTTKKQAGSLDAQRRIDVDYQLRAAQIAAKNGVGHYVLVSSSGADSQSGNAYLQMKGALEDSIASLPFHKITILQPSLLTGPRREKRTGEKIAQIVMPIFTALPAWRKYRPIHCDVVARKMIQACHEQDQPRKTYRLDEIFAR
jgi:uncharacterized protein YbjT (DUF2867 family)